MRQFIQEHKMRDGKGAGGCCGFTGQTIQTPGQSDSQDLLFSFCAVPRVQNQHNWSVRQSKEGLKWWVTEILFGRRTFLVFVTDIPMRAVQGRGPKKRGIFPVVVVVVLLLSVDWVNETPQHSAISSAVWWRAERRATEGIAQERPSHFTFAPWFSDCSSTRRRLMQLGRRQDKERKLEKQIFRLETKRHNWPRPCWYTVELQNCISYRWCTFPLLSFVLWGFNLGLWSLYYVNYAIAE